MALAWDFRFASPRTIERERGGCFFAVSVERRRGEAKVIHAVRTSREPLKDGIGVHLRKVLSKY